MGRKRSRSARGTGGEEGGRSTRSFKGERESFHFLSYVRANEKPKSIEREKEIGEQDREESWNCKRRRERKESRRVEMDVPSKKILQVPQFWF